MYTDYRIQTLITRVLALYDLPNMGGIQRKIADLKQKPADPKDFILLELAFAAYSLECEQRVEMTISLHPSDKSAIEREAELRKRSPSELLTMAALTDINQTAGRRTGIPESPLAS